MSPRLFSGVAGEFFVAGAVLHSPDHTDHISGRSPKVDIDDDCTVVGEGASSGVGYECYPGKLSIPITFFPPSTLKC